MGVCCAKTKTKETTHTTIGSQKESEPFGGVLNSAVRSGNAQTNAGVHDQIRLEGIGQPEVRSSRTEHMTSPHGPNPQIVQDSPRRLTLKSRAVQGVDNQANKQDKPNNVTSQDNSPISIDQLKLDTKGGLSYRNSPDFRPKDSSPDLEPFEVELSKGGQQLQTKSENNVPMSMKMGEDFSQISINPLDIKNDSVDISCFDILEEMKGKNGLAQRGTTENEDGYIYKYMAECLKPLNETQSQLRRYFELMNPPVVEHEVFGENLLDNGFEADSRSDLKNLLIRQANSKVNGFDLPIWDAFAHTSGPLLENPENFEDKTFSFDKDTLRLQNLKISRLRDYDSPVIYHEETMAEGLIFSERNLTPISAALACLIHYDNKLKSRLIKRLIYPHDNFGPCVSKNGKYSLKVHINASSRMIAIDDYLLESNGKMALTTTARNEFWPALVEKAILKLYNCRNLCFKSNPSCEIFHLSGWIPEVIKFSEISDKMQLFSKISQNFEGGNVLLCLGMNEDAFFPVIDFKVKDNKSLVKVIVASSSLIVKDTAAYSQLVTLMSTSAFADETGVKWLDWMSLVVTKFDALYLSWNPSIYSHRFTFDSVWYKGLKGSLFWNEDYSLEFNPQFLIHIPPHQQNLEVDLDYKDPNLLRKIYR